MQLPLLEQLNLADIPADPKAEPTRLACTRTSVYRLNLRAPLTVRVSQRCGRKGGQQRSGDCQGPATVCFCGAFSVANKVLQIVEQ